MSSRFRRGANSRLREVRPLPLGHTASQKNIVLPARNTPLPQPSPILGHEPPNLTLARACTCPVLWAAWASIPTLPATARESWASGFLLSKSQYFQPENETNCKLTETETITMLGVQWEHLLGRLLHFFIYGFSAPWWTILGYSQTEAPRLLDWILPTPATCSTREP